MRITSAIAALTLATAACSSGGNGGADAGLGGSISADGSSTVGPITEAVAEEFQAEQPGVDVPVGISGTGGGFEKFCAGEIDIANASRAIKDEEAKACADHGVEFTELAVALDGLAVVANPDVEWTDCLTLEQLKTIWDADSVVKSWKDVDPGFPDTGVPLFGPGTDSGTFDFFTKEVNGEEGRSRTDYTPSEDDNVLVRGVEGESGSLGYFGVAYFEQNRAGLKGLAVDGGAGCVEPTVDTVQAGEYPLSRPLYIYVSHDSAKDPATLAFVDYYLEVVSNLVTDVGYVPLPKAELDEARAAWERATA